MYSTTNNKQSQVLAQKLLDLYLTDSEYFARSKMVDSKLSYYPVHRPPTLDDVIQHITGLPIGDYTIRPNNTVNYISWDIDSTPETTHLALNIARKIVSFLGKLPSYVTFSGNKGYHVDLFLDQPIPSAFAFAVAAGVRSILGLERSGNLHVETYPKQSALKAPDDFGNLIKLPGCIHPKTGLEATYINPGSNLALSWVDFGTYKTTEAQLQALLQFCKDPNVQIITLIENAWVDGQRNDLSLALAGYLAKKGWSEDQTLSLMQTIAENLGGDPIKLSDTVSATYRKYFADEPIEGFSKLKELLSDTSIKRLEKIVGQHNERLSLEDITERIEEVVKGVESTPLGKAIYMLKVTERNELAKDIGIDRQIKRSKAQLIVTECFNYWRKRTLELQSAGRLIIDVSDKDITLLRNQVEDYITVLNQNDPKHPVLYLYNNNLTKIYLDNGKPTIQELDLYGVRGVLSSIILWVCGDKVLQAPPLDVAQDVYSYRQTNTVYPTLTKVITHPIYTHTGKLLIDEGFDTDTGYYYTGEVTVGDTDPTKDNIKRAKDLLLNELLIDFPFADKASLAHAISLLALPFLYTHIDSITPIYLVDAPTAGTGKSLLVELCAYIALGYEVSSESACTTEDDWRKMLGSKLRMGTEFIFIDNVPTGQLVDSGALASLVTSKVPSMRELGKSIIITLNNSSIWVITGNNFTASLENIRRIVWLRLDSNMESPFLRTGFKHPNIKGWVKYNRNELITAILTLCNAYLHCLVSEAPLVTKGSFDRWVDVNANFLHAIGVEGFLQNESQLLEEATASSNGSMTAFVDMWYTKFGYSSVTVNDLYPLASYFDDNHFDNNVTNGGFTQNKGLNLLADLCTMPREQGRKRQLGKVLVNHRDQVFSGYKMTRTSYKAQNLTHWQLAKDKK